MRLIEGEQVIHEMRPEQNILVIWFFTKALPFAVVATFIINMLLVWALWLPGVLGLGKRPDELFIFSSGGIFAALGIGCLCLLVGLIYIVYLRRTYVYYVTNQRCVFHGGILRRVERSIPYHKVTDVEMSQNIVERILGMSRLNIFTPGTASTYGSYPGGGQRAEISFVALRDSETPANTINEILSRYRATGE